MVIEKHNEPCDANGQSASASSKTKVSSYTQVEPEYVVSGTRRIVGQEDKPELPIFKLLEPVNYGKQNNSVRPPLVGQASSSSNDSVSLEGTTNHSVEDIDNESRSITPLLQLESGQVGLNYNRGGYNAASFYNREDYISQRPPEGSSDQCQETLQDRPALHSPSSVSSITSSRPLEWDSGADVGYNQPSNVNVQQLDNGFSTIDRMVFVCNPTLLTRSDPEGTTGPKGKTYNVFVGIGRGKHKHKRMLGFPNAESTPLGTEIPSSSSPEVNNEDIMSPIIQKEVNKPHTSSSSDENKELKAKNTTGTMNFTSKSSVVETSIPLFPEIYSSNHRFSLCNRAAVDNEELERSSHDVAEDVHEVIDRSDSVDEHLKVKESQRHNKYEPGLNNNVKYKKISSSLENLSTTDNEPTHNKPNSKCLPRSQSQTSINATSINPQVLDNEGEKNSSKFNVAFHYLGQYNKSASSSSITTIVSKKKDSLKHSCPQASNLINESVGIQVNKNKDNEHTIHNVYKSSLFSETPNLPKANTQHFQKSGEFLNKNQGNHHGIDIYKKQKFVKDNLDHTSKITDRLLTHCHDGIPCPGTYKKNLYNEEICHTSTRDDCRPISASKNTHAHQNTSNQPEVMRYNNRRENIKHKIVSGTSIEESIDSSIKSGGGSDNKHYSDTAEDRVNSFEYLPGHVYENSERQVPFDSCPTSSVSIHNQLSKNKTGDEYTSKSWNPTESTPSTLEKDVQKGVNIIAEFARSSCGHDSELKKKLIRRVVEKLITKNYKDDTIEHRPADLNSNVPWIPSQPPDLMERNGRETRRSILRSKVPCEFSSRSEKSTNASSECFIPKPTANSTFLPSKVKGSGCTGNITNSSTSEVSAEKQNHGKRPPPIDIKAKINQYGSVPKDHADSSVKPLESRNWKEPATHIEKLLEERMKKSVSEPSDQSDGMNLVQYLKIERENQLFWIRSEIQHLSNLKELLEKQEVLKRGIKGLKTDKQQLGDSRVLKERNIYRTNTKVDAANENGTSKVIDFFQQTPTEQPTLTAWLERALVNSSSADNTEGTEGWASHHYTNENRENLKSKSKGNSKKEPHGDNKNGISGRDKVTNDKWNSRKQSNIELTKAKSLSKPYLPRNGRVDDSVFRDDKAAYKKKSLTKSSLCAGVQTSDWYKEENSQHNCKCQCKVKTSPKIEQKASKKVPLGYFITFEPPSISKHKNLVEPLEEVRIRGHLGMPKSNGSRRLSPGVDCRGSGNESSREVNRDSSSNNSGCELLRKGKPTIQEAKGMLQYYLLRNRPSYVSRAEDRRQCIAQMQYLRELREQSKKCLLALTQSADILPLAPPPLAGLRRVFSQQTMRRQTERKYRQLAEVQQQKQDTKRNQGYRTNRLMAEIFKKKLQKRVLKGEVNLSNSVSVISNI